MAGGFDPSGRGKKNIGNLNLVPFVDLFSTMIIFLLFTAVWDQLASLQVNLGANDQSSIEAPLEDTKKISSQVRILLGHDFYELVDSGKTERVPMQGKNFNYGPLENFVQSTRTKYEQKKDMLIQVMDNASYESLVAVMDRFLVRDFSDLIVTGSEQKL